MRNTPKTLLIGTVTPSEFEKLRKEFDTIFSVKVGKNEVKIGRVQLKSAPIRKKDSSFTIAILVDESLGGLTHDLSIEWKRQGDEISKMLLKTSKNAKTEKDKLQLERERIADEKFEEFNFHGLQVGDSDGWEYSTPGNAYTKVVYIENGENPDGNSQRCHFHVIFKSNTSAEIQEVYCLDAKTGGEVYCLDAKTGK
ncbi:MAG: hypothetical protein WC375_00205 [Methanomassiliicoccales archaeon]|jgi:hypothetical protein